MVEAAGVERRHCFAVVRDHEISFGFLRVSFSDSRTITHQNEDFASRPVP